MADLDFTVNADTTRAQRNLQNLERSFAGVRNIVGALAGALSVSAFANITSSFTDLQSKLKNATGSADEAAKVFNRLSQTARNTYSSIEQTAGSFLRNNQVLKELGYTTEQQIQVSEALNNALAVSGTKGQQAESVMAALSKAFATGTLSGDNLNTVIESGGRITQALAEGLGVTTGQLRELGRAGELDTGRVINILIGQLGKLKQEAADMPATINDGFVLLTNSLSKLVGEFDKISGGSGSVAGVMERLADSIDSFTEVLSTNANAVRTFVTVVKEIATFAALAVGLTVFGRAILVIGRAAYAAYGFIKTFSVSVTGLISALTTPLTRSNLIKNLEMIPGVGSKAKVMLEAMAVPVDFITKHFLKFAGGIGAVIGGIVGLNKALGDQSSEQDQANNAEIEKLKRLAESRKKEQQAAVASIDLLKKQREEVAKIVDGYKQNNAEALKQIQRDTELIGLTEQQTIMKQALFSLEDRKNRELIKLQELYNEKSKSGKDEDKKSLPVIRAAMAQVSEEYQRQLLPVMTLTQEKLKALEVEKQRLEIERQVAALADFGTKTRIDTERQLRDIQAEIAKSTMTEIEKKYYDISRASQESARSAIEAENARRKAINQPLLTNNEQAEYYQIAVEGNQKLIDLTKQHFEQSRSWSVGWKNAFNEYVSNATNSAQKAQQVFQKATKGMEDALVNFAKTGKFEFRNFTNMVLEELLRIQIQRTFAGLLGGSPSSGGGNFLGKLLGFANGGIIPTNSPVLVGERGPELLVGASGNRVIPNDQLGGGTSVTYNINAVDAASFKQMIASDPSFLFAVTEQGRKTIPAGRR
jgi:lambda family phage tail tape measure protein